MIFLSVVILANLLGIITEYGMQKFGKEKDIARVKKCTVTVLVASGSLSLITLSNCMKVRFGSVIASILFYTGFALSIAVAFLMTFYVEL